jgi:polyhydroxyalkanoate synthase subunit PhaC
MADPQKAEESALTPKLSAPQHKPRPLTLFLEMLRSETAANPERMQRALAGLRAYQAAPREPAQALAPTIAAKRTATLRDYGGDGPPLLFVPSLINPPNVLDLGAERSLLRWLAERGHRVLLLDWGGDAAARRTLSVAGHVEEILLPLIDAVGEPPGLVGYCLGGTMALAAAALAPVRSLTTLAAPWHFSGFDASSRSTLDRRWQHSRPTAAALGALPMEVLQSAFWSLDPARTVAKFEAFADMPPGSQEARRFVTLEDWANDGPPVPQAAAAEMFEGFFRDDLPGSGQWRVCGLVIDPAKVSAPFLNFVSTSDRIVPAASAIRSGERIDLAQGHVGMVVGGRARELLWEPLAAWLSRAQAS